MNTRYPFLEGFGYVISIVSVALLAVAAWLGAGERPELRSVILAGAALSVLGMILRWYVRWRRHGRQRHRHKGRRQ